MPRHWTAEVPSSVFGLQGSCIVIPCSFYYPEPKIKPSELTGIWFKGAYEVIYHPDSSSIIKDYRGRTELVGDLRQKNCSLRIDPLHHSDKGPFTFRLEIKDHSKASYKDDTVSIAVSSSPDPPSLSEREEVKVGEDDTWSHSGTPSIQSQQQTNGQWEETSSMTIRSTIADNNQPLVCTAAYRGGKTVSSSKTLNVKYAPVDVKVEGVSSVKEGDSVELRCSSDSNPAAHSYRWHNSRGPLPTMGSTITLERVTRLTEALYCTASTQRDKANPTPCDQSGLCLHFRQLHDNLSVHCGFGAPRHCGVVSSSRTPAQYQGGDAWVSCHGDPTEGTRLLRDHPLQCQQHTGQCHLVLHCTHKCGKSHGIQPVTSMQDMDAAKCASSDPSPSRKEQKDSSSEIHTNYYTNDQLYGNMEVLYVL
ncbi:sialic acid-binding Ig-like lectin 13 [Coregonus clupeaformis]|uniref:sialic acid-binding Ig-like lectin 13 n=1 Tax=Coregonus clupeaformis TaxID=59861 RepID=UPI001E1C622E|nr:sialic acid-binding Ig-like lectin 13 [Coregonus clupeaformis]